MIKAVSKSSDALKHAGSIPRIRSEKKNKSLLETAKRANKLYYELLETDTVSREHLVETVKILREIIAKL